MLHASVTWPNSTYRLSVVWSIRTAIWPKVPPAWNRAATLFWVPTPFSAAHWHLVSMQQSWPRWTFAQSTRSTATTLSAIINCMKRKRLKSNWHDAFVKLPEWEAAIGSKPWRLSSIKSIPPWTVDHGGSQIWNWKKTVKLPFLTRNCTWEKIKQMIQSNNESESKTK